MLQACRTWHGQMNTNCHSDFSKWPTWLRSCHSDFNKWPTWLRSWQSITNSSPMTS
jgi:hypothetical protein